MPDAAIEAGLQDGKACLEAALYYLSLGWSALAVCPPTHYGVGKFHDCQSPGKRPLGTWKEYQDRLPTERELRDKWHEHPNANVGLALGPVSKLVRIDIEGDAGEEALQRISGGDLPDTLEFSSGREGGGRGLLYRIPDGFETRTTFEQPKAKQEVRFQAKGAQTVLPPSRHVSERKYEWKPGHGPRDREAAMAPGWLLDELSSNRRGGSKEPTHSYGAGEKIAEGNRDSALTSFAGTMRRRGMGERAILAALLAENEEKCEPPLPDSQVEKIARSVAKYEPEPVLCDTETIIDPPEKMPTFPVEIFPTTIQRFVREVAAAVSCPIDFPCLFVLAAAATAIGTSRAIEVSRKWLECPRMYLALVADPGEAKSPAMDMVCEPIYRKQREAWKRYEQKKIQYEEELAKWEGRVKLAGRKGHENLEVGAKDPKPIAPHFYTGDATTESLAVILKETPRGIAMIRDELTSWVSSLNQYKAGGKGSDRQFWLSCWAGSTAKVDRKGPDGEGRTLLVDHPFVTVCGNIQPDMLGELCDEKARQDGFMHRVLFSYPGSGKWPERIGESLSSEAEAIWSVAVDRLYQMEMTPGPNGFNAPVVVHMSPEGRRIAAQWYRDHAQERNRSGFSLRLVGPWAKMKAYYFRIALIIHCLRLVCEEGAGEQVDQDTFLATGEAMKYFKPHCRRVYDALEDTAEDKKLLAMVEWIKTREGGRATVQDIMQGHWAKNAKTAKALVAELHDRQYGQIEKQKAANGGERWTFVLRKAPSSPVAE
jgi:hypothetical protein